MAIVTIQLASLDKGLAIVEMDINDATNVPTVIRTRHTGNRGNANVGIRKPDRSSLVSASHRPGRNDTTPVPAGLTMVHNGDDTWDFPVGWQCNADY